MRRCKVCRKPATMGNAVQAWCSVEHALVIAKANKERADKKAQREARARKRDSLAKLKTKREWLAEAQKAFNAYIRARDEGRPCISCGAMHAAQWDAGHYRSTAAAPQLRFNEDNVHRQCSRPCNKDKSGNLIEYRKGLVARIGLDRVEALENDNAVRRYSIDEIKAIKASYTAKRKGLANNGQLQ